MFRSFQSLPKARHIILTRATELAHHEALWALQKEILE
jgi:hypothetical protein